MAFFASRWTLCLSIPSPTERASREANCLWRREGMQNCIVSLLKGIRPGGADRGGERGRSRRSRPRRGAAGAARRYVDGPSSGDDAAGGEGVGRERPSSSPRSSSVSGAPPPLPRLRPGANPLLPRAHRGRTAANRDRTASNGLRAPAPWRGSFLLLLSPSSSPARLELGGLPPRRGRRCAGVVWAWSRR